MNNINQKREGIKKKKCKYCKANENLTIDHKIPKIQGGTDAINNLQCLCFRCNGTKSGLSDKQVRRLWKWFLWIQEERVKKGKSPYKLK